MTYASESPRTLDTIEADLRDSSLLRDLGVRLASEQDLSGLYREIVAAAMVLTGADAGTLQLFDEEANELVIAGALGFPPEAVEHFRRVDASSSTSCGLALAAN